MPPAAPHGQTGRRDSNPRPSPWQGDALPTEPLPPVCPMRVAERGAEGQIRTDDTRLFRAVLYQLSYLGPSAAAFARRRVSAFDDSTGPDSAATNPQFRWEVDARVRGLLNRVWVLAELAGQ